MESAIRTVKPFVGENTLFLSVLNGISSEGMIEEAYGAPYSLIQKEGEARTMMIEAMREVLRVADTQDVDLSEADISYWLNLLVCGDGVKDRGGRGTFSSGERVFV